MVRVSSMAKLRPWSELTAQNGDGVVPGLVKICLTIFDVFALREIKQKMSESVFREGGNRDLVMEF